MNDNDTRKHNNQLLAVVTVFKDMDERLVGVSNKGDVINVELSNWERAYLKVTPNMADIDIYNYFEGVITARRAVDDIHDMLGVGDDNE